MKQRLSFHCYLLNKMANLLNRAQAQILRKTDTTGRSPEKKRNVGFSFC